MSFTVFTDWQIEGIMRQTFQKKEKLSNTILICTRTMTHCKNWGQILFILSCCSVKIHVHNLKIGIIHERPHVGNRFNILQILCRASQELCNSIDLKMHIPIYILFPCGPRGCNIAAQGTAANDKCHVSHSLPLTAGELNTLVWCSCVPWRHICTLQRTSQCN